MDCYWSNLNPGIVEDNIRNYIHPRVDTMYFKMVNASSGWDILFQKVNSLQSYCELIPQIKNDFWGFVTNFHNFNLY